MLNHAVATLFFQVENEALPINQLLRYARRAAWRLGLHVDTVSSHEVDPQGSSVVLHLNGGHCAVHTYPQEQKIFVDCFTGRDDKDPEDFIQEFAEAIEWGVSDLRPIRRIDPSKIKPKDPKDKLHKTKKPKP